MSVLRIAGFTGLTLGAFTGAGLVALANSKWEFLDSGSPEQLARAEKEETIAAFVMAGAFAASVLVTAFSPYPNLGKGMMLGTGIVAGTLVFDKVFPKAGL